jgi:Protein of unknown function (DUF1588)/Protein of unknown function (DUF1592)/Protein of unknown function (DUF1595)/Protein of unknown function (DUF1585)/Protein of unknown function (DUF1587)
MPVSPRVPITCCVLLLALAGCSGKVISPSAGGSSDAGARGTGGDPNAPFVAFASLVRRHSRAELDLTLRDLLGDQSAPAARFLAEDEFAPYDNDYDRQQASQALIDSLEALAEDVAARALASASQRSALVPCTPTGVRDQACFRKTVEQLGRRAFRRALSSEEVDAYLPLLEVAATPPAAVKTDFYTAVELVLRAILQDPEFLYRIEVGTPRATASVLGGYEIATRLSYLLWGSTPDDALLEAAEAGELADGAGRRGAAARLLDDRRARLQLARFHAMWLGYRAIPHPAELAAAFSAETSALIERVVFDEQRDYLDLFRLDETYVDAMLANHYGLPPPAQGRAWVPYGDSGRAGILSHGSVLAAFSKFSDTSPTQRGIFIRTRLLCQSVGSPPANVMVDQPPKSDESPCKTQRYAAHASGSCAGCHGLIDPIGFGLERYDIAGRYREHDDGLPQCSIAGTGVLPGSGEFSGPAELAARLIESESLDACVVKQYLSFALGRGVADAEARALSAMTERFQHQGRSFRELMLAFVESDAFALRKEPP